MQGFPTSQIFRSFFDNLNFNDFDFNDFDLDHLRPILAALGSLRYSDWSLKLVWSPCRYMKNELLSLFESLRPKVRKRKSCAYSGLDHEFNFPLMWSVKCGLDHNHEKRELKRGKGGQCWICLGMHSITCHNGHLDTSLHITTPQNSCSQTSCRITSCREGK